MSRAGKAWCFAVASCALLAACSGENPAPMMQFADGRSCVPLPEEPRTRPAACALDSGPMGPHPSRPPGIGYGDEFEILPSRVAYLTFDDGPSDWTLEFLQILRDYDVRATFFINAKNTKGAKGLDGSYLDDDGNQVFYRDVLKQTLEEGHAIGNHTVNHLDLAGLSAEEIETELDENEHMINAAFAQVGLPSMVLTLLRVPYGSPWRMGRTKVDNVLASQELVGKFLRNRGLNALWNVTSTDANEWSPGDSYSRMYQPKVDEGAPSYDDKVRRIIDTVLNSPVVMSRKAAVVLMHDTHNTTRDALEPIIIGLLNAGYTFATLEDYALTRWGRPSADLTPGPNLFDACVPAEEWGCATFEVGFTGGKRQQVCGRFWHAFDALGGLARLGGPLGPPQRAAFGPLSQRFEHGVIELHPEMPPPCNVVLKPTVR